MSITLDRLRKLQPVFSLHDLVKDTILGKGLQPEAAKKFLRRLVDKGYVKPAGPRTAFYYNLIADELGPTNRTLEVVGAIYPEAIIIGLNVLHAYGWITQIPRTFDVAVDASRRSLMTIDGIELRKRPKCWFAEQHLTNAVLKEGESPFFLDSVTPRAALNDIQRQKDIWVPGKDDLFIPEDEEESIERIHGLRSLRQPCSG